MATNSVVTAYQFSDKCNQYTRIFTSYIIKTTTLIYRTVLASKKSIHLHLRPCRATVWRILRQVAMYNKGFSDLKPIPMDNWKYWYMNNTPLYVWEIMFYNTQRCRVKSIYNRVPKQLSILLFQIPVYYRSLALH